MSVQDGYYAFDNDMNSVLAALNNCYVISGMVVAEDSPLDMGVVVAAGVYYANGTRVTKGSETDIPLDASDPSLARKDLIVGDSAGTISFVKGTNAAPKPSTNTGPTTYLPVPPDIPADKTLLAEVWVGAGVNSIANASITGRRIVVTQHDPDVSEQVFNIMAYGALGNDSQDDTPKVQAAVDAASAAGGGVVTWPTPPVAYKCLVTPTKDYAIKVRPKVSMRGSGYGCKVYGYDDYALFSITDLTVDEGQKHWKNTFIEGFNLEYAGFQNSWTSAKAIRMPNLAYDGYYFQLNNIAIINAYAGVWVAGNSWWGGSLRTVRTFQCRYGFYTIGGTGWHFHNCYAQGKQDSARDIRGYYIKSAATPVLTACAMDGYYDPGSAPDADGSLEAPFLMVDATGASIQGFQFEANHSAEDGSVLRFQNVKGLAVDGMKGSDGNRVYVAAGSGGLVTFSGSTGGRASGLCVGVASDFAYGGTGRVGTVFCRDSALMEITGSDISALPIGAGTPSVYWLYKHGAGGGVTVGAVALSGSHYDPEGKVVWLRPNKPFYSPRFTTAERDALSAVNGMVIYNTTTNRMEAYENGAWVDL